LTERLCGDTPVHEDLLAHVVGTPGPESRGHRFEQVSDSAATRVHARLPRGSPAATRPMTRPRTQPMTRSGDAADDAASIALSIRLPTTVRDSRIAVIRCRPVTGLASRVRPLRARRPGTTSGQISAASFRLPDPVLDQLVGQLAAAGGPTRGDELTASANGQAQPGRERVQQPVGEPCDLRGSACRLQPVASAMRPLQALDSVRSWNVHPPSRAAVPPADRPAGLARAPIAGQQRAGTLPVTLR